jgi:glycosyltransferase involved in cell wall biosynthesis
MSGTISNVESHIPSYHSIQAPLVLVGSWAPRKCGIATFAEEALEFISAHMPNRPIHIISHLDGRGENVHPLIDLSDPHWYRPLVEQVRALNPYAVHIQHEYGLYNHLSDGVDDRNAGFLRLLEELRPIPTVVETHTVHGRYREYEEAFLRRLLEVVPVLILKCDYQRWRMAWNLRQEPGNVVIIPHGARPDRGHLDPEACKRLLGFDSLVGKPVLGLVGWIQGNKRWDLILKRWEHLQREVYARTGVEWMLLAAGNMRDPNDLDIFERNRAMARELQERGLGLYFEFDPRGEIYYQVMACCETVALPSVDETQSGTLARILAQHKPYITTGPLEGLTSQTIESDAGLLFSNEATLERGLLRLMCDADLRRTLAANARRYLEEVVSWDVVAEHYLAAYERAVQSVSSAQILTLDHGEEDLALPA